MDEAIECGEKLIRARAEIPHGQWGPFLAHYGVSHFSWRDFRDMAEEK